MRTAITAIVLCLVVTTTWAEEPNEDSRGELIFPEELIVLALQQAPTASTPGFDDWNSRLEQARNSRSRAKRLFWIGLGANIGGAFLAGTSGLSCDNPAFDCSGNRALWWTGALISISGGVATIYSIFSWVSAAGDISDLDREGRMKGYLTLAPTHGGAQLAARFTF